MKNLIIGMISTFIMSNSFAAVVAPGETYQYEFNNLYYIHAAEDNYFYDFLSFNIIGVLGSEGIEPYSFNLRLFEDTNSTDPFYSTMITQTDTSSSFGGLLGLSWPEYSWDDLNGYIEIDVIQGISGIENINITIESNNNVYSSIRPVPLPASFNLLLAGIGLIGLTRRSIATQKSRALTRR